MDINCRHCGEPWDIYSLHDVWDDKTGKRLAYKTASSRFRKYGCPAMEGHQRPCSHGPIASPETLDAIGTLTDLLGEDTDGLAAMLEDLR
jgi:hypothetical protein